MHPIDALPRLAERTLSRDYVVATHSFNTVFRVDTPSGSSALRVGFAAQDLGVALAAGRSLNVAWMGDNAS